MVAGFSVDEAYPYQPSVGLFGIRSGESYMNLLNRLHEAARDPAAKGIFIHLEQAPFSLAQAEELRAEIATARSQGKSVIIYLDRSTSNAAYFLASAADKVYLHPAANLNLVGLSAELQFYAAAMDLVGVDAQYARRADYKSAPEQYLSTEASPANREQMNALLDNTYAHFTEGIAESRGRSPEQIAQLIDEGPFTAEEALEEGLVDGLVYPDQLEDKIEALIPKSNLSMGYGKRGAMQGWRAPNEIAVIYVEGVIVTGASSSGGLLSRGQQSGSETITRQLLLARRDPSVRAVVMRVDSPGGSAFASDEIWRAVERLKAKGKPVIVSMGGTAASGGYYVAAGATAIYAMPSTVTGSIGVYSGKFNVEGLYDRLGIQVEQYTRGRNAAMYSLSRPMDDSEYAAMDRMVASTYAQFREKVRQGRNMDEDQVESVTQGRVWTGSAAHENGLVDELGTFHDAVTRARLEAGIRPRAEAALISYSSSGGPRPRALSSRQKRSCRLLWKKFARM
jgi:protease-4